jgi:hypothetical protein
VISIKYIAFVMRADNDGEGGILALTALIMQPGEGHRGRRRSDCSGRPCCTATAPSRLRYLCCRRSRASRSPRPSSTPM